MKFQVPTCMADLQGFMLIVTNDGGDNASEDRARLWRHQIDGEFQYPGQISTFQVKCTLFLDGLEQQPKKDKLHGLESTGDVQKDKVQKKILERPMHIDCMHKGLAHCMHITITIEAPNQAMLIYGKQ